MFQSIEKGGIIREAEIVERVGIQKRISGSFELQRIKTKIQA